MSAIPAERLLLALREADVIREGQGIRRVVIDAQIGCSLVLHVERFGDERVLSVVQALDGIEIASHSTPDRVELANQLGALRAARDEILRRAKVSPGVSPEVWARWVRELFE